MIQFVIRASSVVSPLKTQAIVFCQSQHCAEALAELVQEIAKPFRIGGRYAFQSEPPHLHWNHSGSDQLTATCIQLDEIHQCQITGRLQEVVGRFKPMV
ncbi:MAG TPA: hypothetical protein VGM66_12645 [Candidatus Udaeobacter sp.]|jgi:hypothetical protein